MNNRKQAPILKRVFTLISTLIAALFIVLMAYVYRGFVNLETARREQTLLAAAQLLSHYIEEPFDVASKCRPPGVSQLDFLNDRYQPTVVAVSKAFPKLGLGIYCLTQDAVVAVHPFDPAFLTTVSRDFPYFESYHTRRPHLARTQTSLSQGGQPLLNLTYPVIFGEQVIGHTWANITLNDLYADAFAAARLPIAGVFCFFIGSQALLWAFYRHLQQSLRRFARDVSTGVSRASELMPELATLLEEIDAHNTRLTHEIAQRERAQQELNSLFELTEDLICVTAKGRIVRVNPACRRVLGYEPEELVGMPLIDFVHPLDREKTQAKKRELMATNERTQHFENRYLCRDGSAKWISWSGVVVPGEDVVYGIGRDMTEYKALQEEVMRLDRLNIAGQMAASISHEIRNPMTTIRGFLQLLQSKYQSSSDSRFFELMITELDRANGIISEFLSLARLGSVEKETSNLNDILAALAPLVHADSLLGDKHVAFALGDIPDLELNPKEIRQLVLNLTRNSLEAMTADGEITIATYMEKSFVVLAIKDTGPGVPPHILERLGTPFLTTKENGTGLGLAISYRIAADHGATIKVDTGPRGTTFYIRFKP